jgi:hypothetical protein
MMKDEQIDKAIMEDRALYLGQQMWLLHEVKRLRSQLSTSQSPCRDHFNPCRGECTSVLHGEFCTVMLSQEKEIESLRSQLKRFEGVPSSDHISRYLTLDGPGGWDTLCEAVEPWLKQVAAGGES